MSTTVIEALKNAKANFERVGQRPTLYALAMSQLEHAIEGLENGKDGHDIITESAYPSRKK